jgi:hypothetical protein
VKDLPIEPTGGTRAFRDEEDIAALFRLAGSGDRVPDQELGPIKASARESWKLQVRRTARMRRMVRGAIAVAAAVVLTVAVALLRRTPSVPPAATLQAAATIQAVFGDTTIQPRQPDAAVGMQVVRGATITTGDSGRMALLLADGHSLRIDVASEVLLVSGRTIRLERGAVYVDSRAPDANTAATAVEIETPIGVVRDVGTRFEVRLVMDLAGAPATATGPAAPNRLTVRVRDGAVRLSTRSAIYEAAAGSEIQLGADGGIERTRAAPWSEDWRWVETVRPPVAIEGTTLLSFLDWASRESGRVWRFADPESRRDAEGIVLHGSIEGLTVEEALSTVLPSCGFRHRIEGAVLWIETEGP